MKKLFRYLILFTLLINTVSYGFFRMNNIKVPLRNFLSKSKKLFNVDNHRRDYILNAVCSVSGFGVGYIIWDYKNDKK